MAIDNNNFSTNGFSGNSKNQPGNYAGQEVPSQGEGQDPDEIDLRRLAYKLWHHKWLIISVVLVCGILAFVLAETQMPTYQSEGSMLISQQQNSYSYAGSDLSNLLSNSYGIGMGSTLANELQVLQSRHLSLEMADSLMHERIMRNGEQYPVLFKSYPDDSSMATRDTVALRIRDNLLVTRPNQDAEIVSIAYNSPSPREAAKMVNLTMNVYSEISTHQKRSSASSAVKFLEKERSRIKDSLNQAEAGLRTFMNQNKLVQVDAQTEELIKQMADLRSRKQKARGELVATNSAIDKYQEQMDNIKPGLADQYSNAVGPNMMRLQYQLAEYRIEKSKLLARNPSIKNQSPPPKQLQQLNRKIADYKEQIRNQTSKLLDKGDQYLSFLGSSQDVTKSIADLNQKLIELKVKRNQSQAEIKVLDKQLDKEQQFFDNLPDNMVEMAKQKRNVEISKELYETVSKQYAQMSLWKQTQFGLGRPVDHGYVPEDPIKPNKKLYLLVGFILGGILSVGYIFVTEAFDNKINSVKKLKDFGLPLLSVVPDMSSYIEEEQGGKEKVKVRGQEVSTSMIALLNTISPISESFRRLESNLIYSNPDQPLNTIMVTSSMKGEGKTTVISNLGVVLAEAGYEVIIVDSDLRRPNVHNQFGLPRAPGITEILFESIPLSEAIQPTTVSNLSVLAGGKRPPNPSAVTQSRAFLQNLKELEKDYDFVLIDTPPYGIITDASAIISQTDGVVVVTRFDKTDENALMHVVENLERTNANILGTVLSAFDHTQTDDYYYGSYYYRDVYNDYEAYHD